MRGPVRTVLAILMAIGILISIGDLFDVGVDYGYFDPYDVEFAPVANVADAIAVTSVKQGSQLQRDGVRPGDVLHLEGLSWIERLTFSPDGNAFRATDTRTGKIVVLERRPRPPTAPARRAYIYSWVALRVVIEVAGLTILLLRGATVAGAGLAVFMFFQQFSYLVTTGEFLGRVWMAIYFGVLVQPLQAIAYVAVVAVAFAYVQPSRGRTIAAYTIFSLAAIAELVFLVENLRGDITGAYGPLVIDGTSSDRFLLALTLTSIVLFIVAIRSAYGVERRRLIVLTASLSLGSLSSIMGALGINGAYGLYTLQEGIAATILTMTMGIGLTYGILVERLFDIEFVLNRAVVFTIVSGIVVVSFGAIEWLIGTYAGNLLGRAGSVALQMLIALGIGLWLRRVHAAVDRFVDRWLFEERHRRANALQSFASEAATISTPEALLQATVKTLRTFGGVSKCAVLVANERGDFETTVSHEQATVSIERDDLVAVRLRTARRPLERRDFPPLTAADFAFPMTVGHELAGILLCTQPVRAEPYSPEEIDALMSLSHEVAMALVALEAREARRMRQAFALDRVT